MGLLRMKYLNKCAIAAGFLSYLLAGQAAAHGVYATERQGEIVIVYGHGPSDEKYENKDLLSLVGYDKAGKSVEITHSSKNGYVVFSPNEEVRAISASFDNGYWSEQPDGEWVKKPKDQVEGAKQGGQYLKYNTTILQTLGSKPKPTGAPLEILPLVDPLTLKQGDKLEVQVLAAGKPVPNIELATEFTTDRSNNVVKTDSDGKVTIKIRNDGLNILATETKVKSTEPTKADEVVKFATLAFTFPLRADD